MALNPGGAAGAAPVPARESATLVLMRDRPEGEGRPEVLLVQRQLRDDYAAGVYVFPGGVLEEEDWRPASLALAEGISPPQARVLLESVDSAEKALGYLVAAIRETFEEVGILLARTAAGRPWLSEGEAGREAQRARMAIHDGSLRFSDWLAGQGLRLAVDELVYIGHWITPVNRPKRFDTRFFLARAAAAQRVQPDQREIVAFRWFTPQEAIEEANGGRLRMINATVKNLELLARFPSTEQALAALRGRKVPAILPKLLPQEGGGYRILHPWDPDYDSH